VNGLNFSGLSEGYGTTWRAEKSRTSKSIYMFQSKYENSGGKLIERNGDNVGIMETKNDV